jgi:CRP-like cAMP-binding protein
MFLIDEGAVDVYYGQDHVASLKEGKAFGEISLMYNCPRTATVKVLI